LNKFSLGKTKSIGVIDTAGSKPKVSVDTARSIPKVSFDTARPNPEVSLTTAGSKLVVLLILQG
jgi:hypothetical protein